MPLPPFQVALDDHRSTVARYLTASVGQPDADDCLQETLISALRAYPRLRPGSNVRAWLLTIARNKAMDLHRSRAREPVPVGELPDRPDRDAEEGDGPDEALWAAVRALPAKQRTAVTLRYVTDLSHREIASVLDCSEPAARRSLHEGLTRLREEWT